MYVRAISNRFSRGMSTPEMRAIELLSSSALALLVTRVLADHAHAAVAADDLALLTDLLDTGSDLHRGPVALLVAVRDPTPGEVVGGELHLHLVAGEDADVVHAHLPGDVRQHLVAVLQLHPEHGVREGLEDRAFEHDGVVFRLGQRRPPGAVDTGHPVGTNGCQGTRKLNRAGEQC